MMAWMDEKSMHGALHKRIVETSKIVNGIEWYRLLSHDGKSADVIEDCQCARCGSSCTHVDCWRCGGEGFLDGTTPEGWDSDDPDDMERCDICGGKGGWMRCLSSRAFCEANPMPGRENQPSSASESDGD